MASPADEIKNHEGHDHHDDHEHHEDHFVSKYIFSQDHKMIGKQFLMTAVFMGIIAMLLSIFLEFNWHGLKKTLIHYHSF